MTMRSSVRLHIVIIFNIFFHQMCTLRAQPKGNGDYDFVDI